MLRAVARANERIAQLGLEDACAVVYTGGFARLLNAHGREMLLQDGPPDIACLLIVLQLLSALGDLLQDS